MVYLKMGLKLCLGVVTVRAAVHTIAVPDIEQFAVRVALMLGPRVEVVKDFAAGLADRANVAEYG
jgi:hypothetical protein